MINFRAHLFRTWFRLSRPMTLGVRGIVENAAGQVLFVRHTYTKGLYFPGGGVERGETTMTSLIRELEEEGGVKITGTPSLLGILSNHQYFRNDHVLLYKISADAWQPCGDPTGHEISELVWADPSSPPDDITDGTRRRLIEIANGQKPSDHW